MSARPLRKHLGLLTALGLVLALAAGRALQAGDEDEPKKGGAYGNTPSELAPFRGMGAPYKRFFEEEPTFRGPGAEDPEPEGLSEARIGVLIPDEGPNQRLGTSMRYGVTLALEEANADGGLRPGMPFRALWRDEAQAWGAAANAAVDLVGTYGVWGLVGAFDDINTHVLTRILLKLEVPLVNTAGPDPTLTEHNIPWLVRVRPDDRQTGYALAKRVVQDDGRKRIAVLRGNDRYSRMGVKEFVDAARRLHRPIAVEVRFEATTTDWSAQIDRLKRAKPDALLLWGSAASAGRALAAVRAAGLEAPAYGPDRLADPLFLKAAGAAAEGTVFAYPFSPRRAGEAWAGFAARFKARFGQAPDAVAGYAYDGTHLLLASMREAGLNRVRIREALFAHRRYDGVTGAMRFDVTRNNVSEVILGHVQDGTLHLD